MSTILHVCFPTQLYGTEQSLLLLVQGLARRGYRSIVAVPGPGPLTERLDALNVPVVYVPLKPWLTDYHVGLKRKLYNLYHLPFLLRTATLLTKVIRRYRVDLVHTSNAVVFDGALAAAITRVPHVWHIRDTIEPDKFLEFSFGPGIARSLIKCFSKRVIVISKAVGKAYLETACNADKVRVIHNGVDLGPYEIDFCLIDMRHNLGIPATAKVVGMIAQLRPRKRHEDFLRAAVIVQQAFSEVFFLLVGGDPDAPDEYAQAIKNLSQDLDLEKRVVWLSFYDKIAEIFGALDLLVVPSDDEPFGRVIIEAMAACKPVVASRVGGIPEIIVDDVTGILVPPRSPSILAEAIIRLLKDSNLAETMGQAGRQRVEQHFSAERYVNGVEAVYRELLSS